MAIIGPKEKEVNGTMKSDKMMSLDDAMMLTGFGVYNIFHMLLGGIILMGVITQSLALGYVLPAAQCDLGLTASLQGLLAATPFMAIILTSYVWGWLGDTRGRRPVMLYTMLVSVVFSVFTSFAPDTASFAVLQFLSAVFTSGSTAVVYTYIGEFNNLRHRDKMVTFGSSFVGIGTVVLPGISWLILPLDFATYIGFLDIYYRPWRLLVVACALPFFFSFICLCFMPESPKFLYTAGRVDEALDVVKKIYSVNKRMPADSFPVTALTYEGPIKTTEVQKSSAFMTVLKSMRDQTVPLFRMPLLPWTILLCFVQFGCFASTNGFYVWFPTILNSLSSHEGGDTRICDVLEAGRAPVENGTVVECIDTISTETFLRSIYIGLVFCSMYIIVGFLVDYIGKKTILVTILTVTGACGIGAHLVTSQQSGVILFAIFQMCGACIGLMNAVAVELFPTKYRAMSVCLGMMMGRTGSMVGSNLIGFLLNSNCGVAFYLFGGIVTVNGLVCLTLPSRKKMNKEPTTEEPTQCQTHEPA
ncbi:synaptic vesicle glycoprotein 2B-like [Pectinophora gossypiella]|uniref:synaptic vesicle glycoprotein 2B-like n=1 Tax=Pectinophora gossypiella TaxID=13191 RepID=UPI00214E63AF|nr:synaptic vesicle glycoprotein 2B-like [Pectinophora gossypiella]